jgi:hypothetical protein
MIKGKEGILIQAVVMGLMFGLWQESTFAGVFCFSAALYADMLFGK